MPIGAFNQRIDKLDALIEWQRTKPLQGLVACYLRERAPAAATATELSVSLTSSTSLGTAAISLRAPSEFTTPTSRSP